MGEDYRTVGLKDCGEVSLACQSEVIELAKHLALQEATLRPVLETMVSEIEQDRIRLPSLPAAVTRILDMAADHDVELPELAEIVELDVSLTAKIVGTGNTAYFARAGGPVSSVHEALMRIGTQRAFDVVLMTAVRSQLIPEGTLKERAQDLWLQSLRTGLACQRVLAEVPPWEKSGFLLGLLFAIGRWAILGFASSLSQRGWSDRSLRPEILDSVGDALEAPLGGLVIESWGYSEAFSGAIRNYLRPSQCKGDALLLAQALQAATVISGRVAQGWLPDPDFPDQVLLSKLEVLGIDADRLIEVVDEVTTGFEVLSKIE